MSMVQRRRRGARLCRANEYDLAGLRVAIDAVTEERAGESRGGRIYVMVADDGVSCFKLGFSGDPERRLKELECSARRRIRLVFAFPGSQAEEMRLHAGMGGLRTGDGREWYRASGIDRLADDIRRGYWKDEDE